jgi:ubiquitin C-terminal hydrolase
MIRSSLFALLFVATSCASTLLATGLHNLGNTCYLNAQLQCAFHIPKVRQLVLNPASQQTTTTPDEEEKKDQPTVEPTQDSLALQAMRRVFQNMIQAAESQTGPVTTRILCQTLGINVFEQQDSQEFWKLLLPELHLPQLTDLYQGAFEDYIKALDGSGRERCREEPFLDLPLDVSRGSVSEALGELFGEPELLSEASGNGWRPEKGANKVDAHKGSLLKVQGLSSILQLHLKRFQYDWNTGQTSKLNDAFEFPLELDLSNICKDASENEQSLFLYDLQAVVVHAGEYGCGH